MEHGSTGRAPGRVLEAGDVELFEHIGKNLYTAVLADSLDEIGLREQAMRVTIRPLAPDLVFAGWARTIACVDVYHSSEDPYRVEIEAVDSLIPGEAAVVTTGDSKRNAPWGELLSTAALSRGARGAVIESRAR